MLDLQNAQGGRSRYSKALPSVPVPPPVPKDRRELQLPPLPAAQSPGHGQGRSIRSIAGIAGIEGIAGIAGIPSIPSLRRSRGSKAVPSTSIPGIPGVPGIARKPVGSSTPKPSAPIARRPVGGALQPPAQRASIVPPQPSPTDSICSLLSAYTREPDDPLSGSTYTTASTSNSIPDSRKPSPTARDGPPVVRTQTTGGRRPADNFDSQPEPLPRWPESEQTAAPKTALWKRRPQTADKNKELPRLKLNYSYGSTASISSIQTAVIRASSETVAESKGAEEPAQLSGLSGRIIGPAVKDKRCDATFSMGGAASKHLKDKLGMSTKTAELNRLPVRSDSIRPPTPEYSKGDIDPPPPLGDNITKPASPISASGSPKGGAEETDLSKESRPQPSLPSEGDAKPKISVNPASMHPTPHRRIPSAAADLRLATSLQDLRRRALSPPNDEVSPAATKQPLLSPSLRSRGPSISPDSASNRTFSPGPDGSGIGTVAAPNRRSGTVTGGNDGRIVSSATQGPMYRGRDGTLYAEMKISETPNPRACYFPRQTDKPVGAGTIIPSTPLNRSHFNCFQRHKTMNRRPNRHYSLTCQTCGKADTNDRWVCIFCHLRICDTCLRALNGHGRVLRSLVDQLGISTPLSLSSLSRPASAMGLELPA